MGDFSSPRKDGDSQDVSTPTKDRIMELPETPGPAKSPSPTKLSLNDFEIGETLGHGSFGKVFVATRKGTNKTYAIKMLDKTFIERQNKVHTVMNEKKVLQSLDHVSVIKLFFTFQDAQSLYYVLELCSGGELCDEIRRAGRLGLKVATFFTAEIVKALEYMHGKGILHRDLKPENILITESGHIKICDFGTSKVLAEEPPPGTPGKKKRTKSFVGTAEYVSPEVLESKGPITKSADLWALGCVIYQMLAGKPPFRGKSEYLTFQQILHREFEFPEDFPPVAKDLVNKLLVLAPSERLGVENYDALMKHSFFEEVSWTTLFEQRSPFLDIPSPSVPSSLSPSPSPSSSASPSSSISPTRPSLKSPLNSPSKEDIDSDEEEFMSPTKPKDSKFPEPSTPQLIAQSDETSSWAKFCMKGESLVFNGLVKKGRAIFAKKRQLVLTDFPRFVYLDPVSRIQKGEIQWSSELWAEFKDEKNFILYTPGRKYYFAPLSCGAKQWVDEINRIKQQKGYK